MILTDADIRNQVKTGYIEISDFNEKMLGSNSYDLRLSKHLLTYVSALLDAKEDNAYTRFEIPEEGFVLQPGKLYLGSTMEFTRSDTYAPFIEGKSSIGRLGMSVHVTAGVGDIGFAGHWTLEITVIEPLRVYAEMPVAQIMFLVPLGLCTKPYNRRKNAKYQNQSGLPMPSAMWKNFENQLV